MKCLRQIFFFLEWSLILIRFALGHTTSEISPCFCKNVRISTFSRSLDRKWNFSVRFLFFHWVIPRFRPFHSRANRFRQKPFFAQKWPDRHFFKATWPKMKFFRQIPFFSFFIPKFLPFCASAYRFLDKHVFRKNARIGTFSKNSILDKHVFRKNARIGTFSRSNDENEIFLSDTFVCLDDPNISTISL